ncbi:MAG: hypothetical protein JWO82_3463 [Akkermansiaceae bacterium]|nr:hypothetical protein [Akkermansiaceae bacterium]
MSDLETSITEWRTRLHAAGITATATLDELESHLRDDFAAQIDSGLTAEQAFARAVENLGSPQDLQREFAKPVHPKAQRGQLDLTLLAAILQCALTALVLFAPDMTPGQRLSGIAAIGASVLIAATLRSAHRLLPAIREPRHRQALLLTLGLLPCLTIAFLAQHFLTDPEISAGAYLAQLLWVSSPPLAAYFGIIGAVEAAARKDDDAPSAIA